MMLNESWLNNVEQASAVCLYSLIGSIEVDLQSGGFNGFDSGGFRSRGFLISFCISLTIDQLKASQGNFKTLKGATILHYDVCFFIAATWVIPGRAPFSQLWQLHKRNTNKFVHNGLIIHSSNKLINRDRGGERRKAANAIPSNNVHKSSADATQLYYTIMWGSGEGNIVYQVYRRN